MAAHTHSGIPGVGPVEWGTHFCQFYDSAEDLADTLVPYFKAGLENREKCLWVTAEPYGVEAATSGLRTALPDFDRRVAAGEVEIVHHQDWYERSSAMTSGELLASWIDYKDRAVDAGFSGLRLTGNLFWLQPDDWASFADYERQVSPAFCGHKVVALCSYCLGQTGARGVLDVVRNHEFAVARRDRGWEVLESAGYKAAKAELASLNSQLEERVSQQTEALRQELAHRETLFREVHHRVKNNLQIVSSLLSVKARQFDEDVVVQAFDDTMARVRSMSLVHEALYSRDDTHRLDLGDYIRELCADLALSYGTAERVGIAVDIDRASLDLNRAIPLGLIVTELVSNALKHAFGDGSQGSIRVALTRSGADLALSVEDNGVGLAPADYQKANRGAGLSLLKSLVKQLAGRIDLASKAAGTRIVVTFPYQDN